MIERHIYNVLKQDTNVLTRLSTVYREGKSQSYYPYSYVDTKFRSNESLYIVLYF